MATMVAPPAVTAITAVPDDDGGGGDRATAATITAGAAWTMVMVTVEPVVAEKKLEADAALPKRPSIVGTTAAAAASAPYRTEMSMTTEAACTAMVTADLATPSSEATREAICAWTLSSKSDMLPAAVSLVRTS